LAALIQDLDRNEITQLADKRLDTLFENSAVPFNLASQESTMSRKRALSFYLPNPPVLDKTLLHGDTDEDGDPVRENIPG
jgi:hypothetical protein